MVFKYPFVFAEVESEQKSTGICVPSDWPPFILYRVLRELLHAASSTVLELLGLVFGFAFTKIHLECIIGSRTKLNLPSHISND